MTRELAASEHILAPGRTRPTRLAMLYSLSSDLWQPFGYLSMLERRLTYFSLIHDQYLVDFLTERDVENGRLKNYEALYVTDPCVSTAACAEIRRWVQRGGWLYGSCAAGNRNEFNEEQSGLADVFGIAPKVQVKTQKGRFSVRGALNDLPWLDQVQIVSDTKTGRSSNLRASRSQEPALPEMPGFGALGLTTTVSPTTAKITGTFSNGSPATLSNRFGRGTAIYAATCPAVSYAKDAHFVPAELKEEWPAAQRWFINSVARGSGAPRLVELSEPVVEAGVFESKDGAALVLANFTYEKIPHLEIRLPVKKNPRTVKSTEKGMLPFTTERAPSNVRSQGYSRVVKCAVALGLNDIILFE
jgi:hypothetical protein